MFNKFLKKIKENLKDFFIFIGFCSILWGFYQIYVPFFYILLGITLIWVFYPVGGKNGDFDGHIKQKVDNIKPT